MNKIQDNYPKISVIIPSFNGLDILPRCLDSLVRQTYPLSLTEIIVIDSDSKERIPSYLRKIFPQVKFIRLSSNQGSTKALNKGVEIAKGEYILATNDDVVFEKNCLKNLLDTALSDPKIGITTGKMLYLDKPHNLAIPGFRINHYLGYYPYDLENSAKIRECDWAVGACLLIKKSLFQNLGNFDEGYIFCGEEYDLSFQVKRNGLKIMYTPKAVFYHQFKRSKNPNPEILFSHYRGKIRYILKNGRADHLLIFLPLQLVIMPLLHLLKGETNNLTALIKAIRWNLKNLKQTIRSRHLRKDLKSAP